MSPWLTFTLVVLATVRVTRLITTDSVTRSWRMKLAQRLPPGRRPIRLWQSGRETEGAELDVHWLVELVNCDWCTSMWVAAGAVLLAHPLGVGQPWRQMPWWWLGAAGAAGMLLNWTAR